MSDVEDDGQGYPGQHDHPEELALNVRLLLVRPLRHGRFSRFLPDFPVLMTPL
jgi:hypothetical protein